MGDTLLPDSCVFIGSVLLPLAPCFLVSLFFSRTSPLAPSCLFCRLSGRRSRATLRGRLWCGTLGSSARTRIPGVWRGWRTVLSERATSSSSTTPGDRSVPCRTSEFSIINSSFPGGACGKGWVAGGNRRRLYAPPRARARLVSPFPPVGVLRPLMSVYPVAEALHIFSTFRVFQSNFYCQHVTSTYDMIFMLLHSCAVRCRFISPFDAAELPTSLNSCNTPKKKETLKADAQEAIEASYLTRRVQTASSFFPRLFFGLRRMGQNTATLPRIVCVVCQFNYSRKQYELRAF